MSFELVASDHPRRRAAEAFVRRVYASRHAAVIHEFPETLAALFDTAGAPSCVAGIRFGLTECFSEQYLDLPIEVALRDATGITADRHKIMEVTTLASDQRQNPFRLIDEVIGMGRCQGMRWGVFTATRRLRVAMRHSAFDVIELAPARRDRIVAADDWGRYYETDPWVCAVSDGVRPARRHGAPASASPAVAHG